MRYLAVQVADCDEGKFDVAIHRLMIDLQENYPIVVAVKEVELDDIDDDDFESVQVLT
jgi:hypothetical protein